MPAPRPGRLFADGLVRRRLRGAREVGRPQHMTDLADLADGLIHLNLEAGASCSSIVPSSDRSASAFMRSRSSLASPSAPWQAKRRPRCRMKTACELWLSPPMAPMSVMMAPLQRTAMLRQPALPLGGRDRPVAVALGSRPMTVGMPLRRHYPGQTRIVREMPLSLCGYSHSLDIHAADDPLHDTASPAHDIGADRLWRRLRRAPSPRLPLGS